MFYGNLAQLGKKSDSVLRSRSVMSKIGAMSYQWRVSLFVVMSKTNITCACSDTFYSI